MRPVLDALRHGRLPGIVGSAVFAVVPGACSDPPPSVAAMLAEACADARDHLAVVPPPVDADSEAAFMDASREATRAVASVADDLAERGDDRTIADLAWQLYRFPTAGDADEVLRVAHEASAAITRLDGFAHVLDVPGCGAATWRADAWRAVADRRAEHPSDAAFHRRLDRLCAKTFPDPAALAGGAPLLDALVAGRGARPARSATGAREALVDSSDHVKARVIARLNTVTTRPSDTARFIGDFSNGLPTIRPSADLEEVYVALLAAFIRLESVVPSAMPKHPPPATRERLDAALGALQDAWEALGIRCRR
jgi:hypothetical protein